MMWGYYDAWSWIWMAAMMVLVWGGILALSVWAIRSFSGPRHPGGDQALETLRRRFAAGEISQEEFDKTRRALMA